MRTRIEENFPLPRARAIIVVIVLAFSSLSTSLMQSLVIPIQPQLPTLLGTSASNTAWVVTATLLGGAVAMPIAGRLADIRGKKPVLVVSSVILLVGSLICASTSDLFLVLLGRALQGLAMGYTAVAISLVGEVVPANLRNTAIATISATLGVGAALGLPIAAWIAEDFDWHALFWLAAVLASVMLVLTIFALPSSKPRTRERLDWFGALGLSIGLVTLLVGISKGNDWGWGATPTLAMIVVGVAVLIVWGFFELQHRAPLVDLRVTIRRPVLLTNLAGILAGFGMMAQSIVVPQLLQMPEATGFGLGQSLLQTGLWMAPAGLMMLLFSPISGRMLTVYGGRITLATGLGVLSAGYLVAYFLTSAPWQLMLASCISMAGIGIGYAAMPSLVMENSPASESGASVGINSLMRSMGSTVAGAIMAVVLTSNSISYNGILVPSQDAFQWCFLIGAAAAATAMLMTLMIRKEVVLQDS